MKSKHFYLFCLFLLVTIIFSTSILAQELPVGLQKIIEYNKEQADFYLNNLSFLIAFLAGILSLLLPCTIAILPAFFAYTFKERKEITKMTLIFFLGFSSIFIILGLIAAFLGKSIVSLQVDTKNLILIAGIIIIIFGVMTIFGKGFTFIKLSKKVKHNTGGIFLFGILFGLGWSACLGPILSGILLIASTFQNYVQAGILLFFYSLGLFVPLFLISIFFDKSKILQSKLIIGREFSFKIGNKKINLHSTNLIAGFLLIILGLIFLFFKGTSVINKIAPSNAIEVIYSLERKLIYAKYINIIGAVILILFLLILLWFLVKSAVNKTR